MASSFAKQFAISDSDEDSADEEVASRRARRSVENPSLNVGYPAEEADAPVDAAATDRASNKPVSTSHAPPAAAEESPKASARSSMAFQVEDGSQQFTADNSPQRNLSDGHSIKFESVPRSPAAPPPPPLQGLARKEPETPRTPNEAARPAPPVPLQRGPGSLSGIPSAPPESLQESRASHGGSSRNTPREGGDTPKGSAESEGHRRRKKSVRRHRKKSSRSDTPAERTSEGVATPARTGSPGLPPPTALPPPPSRVSPRALRAASSRANTPRSGSVESGLQPLLPPSRGQSPVALRTGAAGGGVVERRVAPPLVPGRTPTANATSEPARTPQSTRSFVIEEEEGTAERAQGSRSKRSGGGATPVGRSSADGGSAARARPSTPPSEVRSAGAVGQLEEEDATTSISFQVATGTSHEQQSMPRPRTYAPHVPNASALATPRSTYEMDDEGNVVRIEPARIHKQVKPDGSVVWVLVGEHRDDSTQAMSREIPAPPKKLSQRAQDIMAAKRRSVEQSAKKRHTAPKSLRRPHPRFAIPLSSYCSKDYLQRHVASALAAGNSEWMVHRYDHQAVYQRLQREEVSKDVHLQTEQLVRAIQPIQVVGEADGDAKAGGRQCGCVEYASDKEAQLGELLRSEAAMQEGFKRYLNLQPMQLANVEMDSLTDPQTLEGPSASRRPSMPPSSHFDAKHNVDRGLATLGGLWCTAEALREDNRPATRPDAKAPRRVMRVCGGPALGLPLREEGQSLDVRCYELLLFPQESVSPSAVNYGSEGLTLGQLISPPASSFPLTPRIVDDPIQLKEYKKRILSTKSRSVAVQNSEDDRLTFFGSAAAQHIPDSTPTTGPTASAAESTTARTITEAGKYLTITLVTLSTLQKHTINLTLVLLPFRTRNVDGGKTLAEVPRFCPFTVATNRRLQGLSLSFSTKSSFLSAYRSLLWATECNIIDIQPTSASAGAAGDGDGLPYLNLRVSATPSPLLPWSSSMGKARPNVDPHDTFHGSCVDFAVVTLSASPTFTDSAESGYRDPLTLDDFVVEEYNGGGAEGKAEEGQEEDAKSRQVVRRRSSIYTSTLIPPSAGGSAGEAGAAPAASESTTVVGLTSFGVIRRAVNQKTSEVFDVRVLPRSRARMCPGFDEESHTIKTAKMEEEQLLQQDVEAAIMMEYTSRLPFQSRVYGVLVDEQRYYVFQEPWISALALEQSAEGTAERDALNYNSTLKGISDRTSVMSLKEFIHGVLRPDNAGSGKDFAAAEEARLQIAQTLIAQLLLLLTSLHGKGMLLGPCPPHRLLVRVEVPQSHEDALAEAQEGQTVLSKSEEPTPLKSKSSKTSLPVPHPITSDHVQLCVLDLGVNTCAWSFERQQCGVLEYIAPSYTFEYMLGEDIGKESRAWTMHDDWWSFLCICFELLAADGSSLVKPKEETLTPTPTPIISKFSSPVDILNIWKEVLTNKDITGSTVGETVAARVHQFVRARVLASISPTLDSWIANKAEELEFFGTTTARAHRKAGRGGGRAVPPAGGPQGNTMLGVSLASMYFRRGGNTPSNASDTSGIQFYEDTDTATAGDNVLKEMSWIFQYRDLFDSIMDVVYPGNDDSMRCSVHGPSAHLLSHPFFSSLDMGKVFDGTQILPPAAAHMVRTHMTKAKVKDSLLHYRAHAYRGPIPKRPEYPLMITGSAFNVGNSSATAPLLLLTSPAYRDELSTREMDTGYNYVQDADGYWQSPQEGLVSSPANSAPPSMVPSPRACSPAVGQGQVQVHPRERAQQAQPPPWAQQGRLRTIYRSDELQSIAHLENEVRSALYSHTARDPVARREMELPLAKADAAGASRQGAAGGGEPPPFSITNENGSASAYQFPPPPKGPVRGTSAASSNRRRDPSEYEVVDARSSILAPTAEALRSDRNAAGGAPYQQTSTRPFVSVQSGGPPTHDAEHATPTRHTAPRGQAAPGPAPPHQYGSAKNGRVDYSEVEQSLNDLAADSVTNGSDVGRSGGPAGQSGRWPNEFLGNANLDKKGTPVKLSDPLLTDYSVTREEAGPNAPGGRNLGRTGSSYSGGGGSRGGREKEGKMVASREPGRRQQAGRPPAHGTGRGSNSGEGDSIILVASDDDDNDEFVLHANTNSAGERELTYPSSGRDRSTASRKNRIPAWRRTSADDRAAYFEF